MAVNTDLVKAFLLSLQEEITTAFQSFDPDCPYLEDEWQREQGGGGRTRVFHGGEHLEKGGVNFSHIYGEKMPASATARRPELAGRSYQAMGVSVVAHPKNPYCPTSHMNVRMFIAEKEGEDPVWWFGGGFDLTPYYGFVDDAVHWHQMAHAACEPMIIDGEEVYPRFKQWCDEYFYLKHRNEPRGIGGLFFDDIDGPDFDTSFQFLRSVGQHYTAAYMPILERRKDMAWGERERHFQNYRRARYVEFNLVFDRGTLFGLQSGGRTESILMSMPPMAGWEYQYHPEPNTPEAELYDVFLQPQDWLHHPQQQEYAKN